MTCPKFDDMPRLRGVRSCGYYQDPLRHHCPKVECYHFVEWIWRMIDLPYDLSLINMERVHRLGFV